MKLISLFIRGKMYYYEIAVPVGIRKLFTYGSDRVAEKGCRVLVSFNGKNIMGFVWTEVDAVKLDKKIRYKKIIETIDERSMLTDDLLRIAEWISTYYCCNLGIVLYAMLPVALQLQVIRDVQLSNEQWIDDITLSDNQRSILSALRADSPAKLSELKSAHRSKSIYKDIELLEDLGYIRIARVFDSKVKPKYANYISVLPPPAPFPVLTTKQQDAYKQITAYKDDFPLALIVDYVSYALIKALKSKMLISVQPREIAYTAQAQSKIEKKQITLTEEQERVFSSINDSMSKNMFKPFLLYGITGSGKTEIYIRLITRCLDDGKSALVLVPEIALTPQMEEWFYSIFGDTVAIIHSRRSERERWEEWKKIKEGKCRIVIGPRSAIFAPLTNPGIIIVDEEHESSYKQDRSPRYNARDIAVLRAKINNIPVVLGSATPSLESLFNAQTGKYQLLRMMNRPNLFQRPAVRIIDMKNEEPETLFSDTLIDNIKQRLAKNEQTLLLLNRRGYASYVICMTCGLVHKCPKCDVTLIYHSESHNLMCHYCGHTEAMKQKCSECGSYVLVYGAAGTQQLEKQLQILFPNAGLLRMDTDTTTKKNSYHSMFSKMKRGNVDILFGTQMIAKGLDFEKVTLVGVINADNSINIPDFRAAEKAFQLLTQVAGRSGRGKLSGEVIIQTLNPDHYILQSVKNQDFDQFSKYEIPLRKEMRYPPFLKIGRLIYSHSDNDKLSEEMKKVKVLVTRLMNSIKSNCTDKGQENNLSADPPKAISVLGPVATPIKKINDRYRYHIIIKSPSIKQILQMISNIEAKSNISGSIKVDIDVDPASLM